MNEGWDFDVPSELTRSGLSTKDSSDTYRGGNMRYIGKRRNYDTWPWKLLFAAEAVWEWFTALFRRSPKMVQKSVGDNVTQIQIGHGNHAHFRNEEVSSIDWDAVERRAAARMAEVEDITGQPNIYGQYWKA